MRQANVCIYCKQANCGNFILYSRLRNRPVKYVYCMCVMMTDNADKLVDRVNGGKHYIRLESRVLVDYEFYSL